MTIKKIGNNMKKTYDIAVIGGGASGLAAAITAKREAPHKSVAIFEKKENAGKKLSMTGNGRCNISNVKCEFYEQIQEFFRSVGIVTRCDEEGRVYPYSEEASAVTAMLAACAEGAGVDIFTESQIDRMEAEPKGCFLLFVGGNVNEIVEAERVLIATGGKSYAMTGTTGDGYVFARKLGHRVSRLAPGLTAVETEENLTALKGLRCKSKASLYKDNDLVMSQNGEVQFRKDSLSGICIMNLSSHIKLEDGEKAENGFSHYRISLNIVSDYSPSELMDLIGSAFEIKGISASDAIQTLAKKPLRDNVLRSAGIDPLSPAQNYAGDKETILAVVNGLRNVNFRVKNLKGWNEAQVTAGGVSYDEINPVTMESLIVPGLYFSGEVLDYDGLCGGFNLHNAWLTGILAGKAMAQAYADFGQEGIEDV